MRFCLWVVGKLVGSRDSDDCRWEEEEGGVKSEGSGGGRFVVTDGVRLLTDIQVTCRLEE